MILVLKIVSFSFGKINQKHWNNYMFIYYTKPINDISILQMQLFVNNLSFQIGTRWLQKSNMFKLFEKVNILDVVPNLQYENSKLTPFYS